MSDSRSTPPPGASRWRPWRMEELGGTPAQAPAEHTATAREHERERAFQHQSELAALRQLVREQAHQEGYQAGFAEGRDAGHAEGLAQGRQAGAEESARQRQALLAPLAGLAERFQAALAGLDDDIADHLVALALATGRQLAGEAFKARPHQILAVIRRLLREEPLLSGAPRLWLHPEDLALVEQALAGELHAAGWSLHPDDQLQRGGCRVSSANGELDASVESRWQAVLARLRQRPRASASASAKTSTNTSANTEARAPGGANNETATRPRAKPKRKPATNANPRGESKP